MQASSSCLSILHITDPHILATPEATLLGINTAYYFNAVLEHAVKSKRHFDLCLLTGDLAQDPCPESYQYLLAQLQKLNIPTRCLPGNHDDLSIMQAVLHTKMVNCEKHFMLGNWQIINLNSQIPNSQGGCVSKDELAFLERCLVENQGYFALIAVHHHCLPTRSRWMDTMMIENAEELLALIDHYPNAKVIINGHIHQAMDEKINSIRVLTTPSTCFQFKPHSEHFNLDDMSPGYRWLNLYTDGSIDSEETRLPEPLDGLLLHTQGY
jgi:3',5'-cyclic-AMP phosphodiesterase